MNPSKENVNDEYFHRGVELHRYRQKLQLSPEEKPYPSFYYQYKTA
jgi:hypothetical protein